VRASEQSILLRAGSVALLVEKGRDATPRLYSNWTVCWAGGLDITASGVQALDPRLGSSVHSLCKHTTLQTALLTLCCCQVRSMPLLALLASQVIIIARDAQLQTPSHSIQPYSLLQRSSDMCCRRYLPCLAHHSAPAMQLISCCAPRQAPHVMTARSSQTAAT
jgi:hypothetical protein